MPAAVMAIITMEKKRQHLEGVLHSKMTVNDS